MTVTVTNNQTKNNINAVGYPVFFSQILFVFYVVVQGFFTLSLELFFQDFSRTFSRLCFMYSCNWHLPTSFLCLWLQYIFMKKMS